MVINKKTRYKPEVEIGDKTFEVYPVNDFYIENIFSHAFVKSETLGFSISISNINLNYLVKNTIIDKGKISSNCLIVKNENKFVILVEGTKEYAAVINSENEKVYRLKRGNSYLLSGYGFKDNLEYVYLGKVDSLSAMEGMSINRNENYYLLYSISEKIYMVKARTSFYIDNELEFYAEYSDIEENVKRANRSYLYQFQNKKRRDLKRIIIKEKGVGLYAYQQNNALQNEYASRVRHMEMEKKNI